MALLRASEIRKMTSEQRFLKLAELRTELGKLRATQAMGSVPENPSRVRVIRKAVARILTIENESRFKEEKVTPEQKAAKRQPRRKAGEK